jgi:hypothetical protein
MADVQWTEEGQSAPPKKKIPTWVWFCGGGCLAMVVLAIVAAGLVYKAAKTALDPEQQWPKLQQVLPFDERPENLAMQVGVNMGLVGVEQYVLRDTLHGLQLQIQHHSGDSGSKQREQMFGSDKPAFPSNFGFMKFEDMQPGVVEVQGRDLRVIRMRMELPGGNNSLGSMMMVDATREGDAGMLFLQVMREGSSAPITDDDLRDLLKPFHVGPNR